MKIIRGIGRIIFALAFATFGIIHLIMGSKFGGEVPAFFPVPAFWVYLTGAAYIAAAISLIIEVQTRLACLLLGFVVFFIAFSIHLPGMIHASNSMGMLGQLINFVKAMAIASAAWFIGGYYGTNKRTSTI